MTFPAGDWRPVKELLKRVLPFDPLTTSASFILTLVAENKELEAAIVTARNAKLLGVTPSNMPSHSPDPDPSPLKTPDQEEEKKKTLKGEDRKGSVRGNLDFGQVAKVVVGRVNELKPKSPNGGEFQPSTYKAQIGKLLQMGFSEADMMTVVEWKAAECERQGDWQWFKPGTIFRQRRFGELVDEAKVGVEHSPQRGFAFTDGEKRADRWDKRKEPGYYDD